MLTLYSSQYVLFGEGRATLPLPGLRAEPPYDPVERGGSQSNNDFYIPPEGQLKLNLSFRKPEGEKRNSEGNEQLSLGELLK
jgi:hypothetical protein